MNRFRSKLTYANVVATLALFLALGGGAVWAGQKITSKQIGKGAVKNKNLAKNAVKTKNLAKNAVKTKNLAKNAVKAKSLAAKAVTSAKLADGSVTNPKIGDGAVNFAKLAAGTNVIASATAGPVAANQEGIHPLPLSNPISVTPVAGQPITVNIEARASLTEAAASECSVNILPSVNGNFLLIGELLGLRAPGNPPDPLFPNGFPTASVTFPVGLTRPGQAQDITLSLIGDTDCSSSSMLDQVTVVASQVK